MLFSSLVFLFVFLPLLLGIYFISDDKNKNNILLAFSLFFYAWGEPKYIAIMIFSILLNYTLGILVDNYKNTNKSKLIMFLSIFINLGILFYFKYINFVIENLNNIFSSNIALVDVVMPIGISFFTFQALSYVADVYMGKVEVQKDVYKVALYISLFPQLIAGPIVKYKDVAEQLEYREHNINNAVYGSYRFITGFAKKIILANAFGSIADEVYSLDYIYLDTTTAWIGSIAYSLQLYFDFSAYSDMAIGLGKIFGFTFLENFNYPYISRSITEFWRRWHISLGTWFREYLYIPLGGNRKGIRRTYINLFMVFFVTGIWHGASWSFILWGIWHGIFTILERLFNFNFNEENKIKSFIKHIYALLIVQIGWVFFRAETLSDAVMFLKRMFFIDTDYVQIYGPRYFLDNNTLILLAVAILISTPACKNLFNVSKVDTYAKKIVYLASLTLLFICSIAILSATTFNPFIYFRF